MDWLTDWSINCFLINFCINRFYSFIDWLINLSSYLLIDWLIDLLLYITDIIDIVKDPIANGDYRTEEDPRLFHSEKTNRGPLGLNWRKEHMEIQSCRENTKSRDPRSGGSKGGEEGGKKTIMCSYKLCRVEFRYWGLQGKIERFIHDIGRG